MMYYSEVYFDRSSWCHFCNYHRKRWRRCLCFAVGGHRAITPVSRGYRLNTVITSEQDGPSPILFVCTDCLFPLAYNLHCT